MYLYDLCGPLILAPQLGGLLELLSLLVFVGLHVGVEDHPLGGLDREDRGLRRVSLDSALTDRQVEGLGGPLLVVEHVSQRLLLLFLAVVRHFAALFFNRLVDLVQESEIVGLLLVEVLVLIAGLFRFLEQDVALY